VTGRYSFSHLEKSARIEQMPVFSPTPTPVQSQVSPLCPSLPACKSPVNWAWPAHTSSSPPPPPLCHPQQAQGMTIAAIVAATVETGHSSIPEVASKGLLLPHYLVRRSSSSSSFPCKQCRVRKCLHSQVWMQRWRAAPAWRVRCCCVCFCFFAGQA